MPGREYDAIVVGASFAGLAVARELRGEVLLLDRHEVGTHQTSSCGTPLWVPQALGLGESVLQVHRQVVVHAPARTVVFDVADEPYCTFDYGRFCRGLLEQCRVRFLRAAVTGLVEGAIETSRGRFRARCVVDSSGWQGVLANGRRGRPARAAGMSFGLETETDHGGEALRFWASPAPLPDGIAWLFPTGRGSRVGVGSYLGRTKLRDALERFVGHLDATATAFHGTYLPCRLGPATAGQVFLVGDAAGHCLPFTAEGIRPALYFGRECGRLVQQVIEGTATLGQALAAYARLVERYRWAYRLLAQAQWVVTRLPGGWLGMLAAFAAHRRVMPRWWPRYSRFGGREGGRA